MGADNESYFQDIVEEEIVDNNLEVEEQETTEEEVKEEVVDYAKLFEAEKAKVEKIGSDYKKKEQEAHKLIQSIAEIKGALESSGVGEITEDGKIKVYVNNNQKPESVIDILTKEKAEIKRKYDEGEIEQDDYIDKLSMYNAKILMEEEKKEKPKEEKVVEKQEEQPDNSKQLALFTTLNKTFPDHNSEGSMLHSEMSKLIAEKPDVYADIDYTDIKNVRMRYLLAEEASKRLASKGITGTRANPGMKTFSGTGTNSVEEASGLTSSQDAVVRSLKVTDKKVLKAISDQAKNLNKGSSIYINY